MSGERLIKVTAVEQEVKGFIVAFCKIISEEMGEAVCSQCKVIHQKRILTKKVFYVYFYRRQCFLFFVKVRLDERKMWRKISLKSDKAEACCF